METDLVPAPNTRILTEKLMSQLYLTETDNTISVFYDDKRPLFTYSSGKDFRPYLHPLYVPGTNAVLTRFRPHDHPWQYGIFVGMNQVNGYDFWCCEDDYYDAATRGSIRNRSLAKLEESGSGVRFEVINDWHKTEGDSLLEETQRFHVPPQEISGSYIFDFEWTLRALDEDITFDTYKYGGVSARIVGEMAEFRRLTAEGSTEVPREGEQVRSKWVSIAAPVDNLGTWQQETWQTFAHAGLAIMDHPSNRGHPTAWCSDGGFLNPSAVVNGGFTLKRGTRQTFRYRFVVFAGIEDADVINASYDAWVAEDSHK
jgi:hypothetical protein